MSTPLHPVELPPFQLTCLAPHIYAPSINDQIIKSGFVKSVEANLERIWVAGSEGKIRIYNGKQEKENILNEEREELQMLEEVSVTGGRKNIDRIALLNRLGKAVILSEGILTFHSLDMMTPLPVQSFPAMKGVVTFSLDEDELNGAGDPNFMHLCAIRKRTVHVLRITNEGVSTIRENPLRGGAYISIFRRRHVCIADLENYSIVDLDESRLMPLLPISQSPNLEVMPLSSTASGTATPPQSASLDPRQRPAVACIAPNQFLIATHTGNTTLGVFVTETGEPCRGTLEWASNLRSLCIEPPYVIALLYNNTIEIHSYETQEIVQLITLPTSAGPNSFQPRSLSRAWPGIDIGGTTGFDKMRLVSIPLLASNNSPDTPNGIALESAGGRKLARTLVVGKNSLFALAPLTLVAQAEALIEKDRVQDALSLVNQIESAGSSIQENSELIYVFLRIAFLSLQTLMFQDAFDLFLRSNCDPRIVIRMWEDLREGLITGEEMMEIPIGLELEMKAARTIDNYILASLTRNYSPHVMPDIESATATSELRLVLSTTARDCLRSYLVKWRKLRKAGTISVMKDSKVIDMVVDTVLVRLYAEEKDSQSILSILNHSNDCDIAQAEESLLNAGQFSLLASVYEKEGEIAKTLEIWTKIIEGIYIDEELTNGIRRIFDLLWSCKEQEIVIKYGLWLIVRDRALGLKLFTDPRQVLTFDTKELSIAISDVDQYAADLFLESVVLSHRDPDSRLHADLVQRYIERLNQLLVDSSTRDHLRNQELAYRDNTDRTQTLLEYLTNQVDPTSTFADFDRVRLKLILFLGSSSNYEVDKIRKDLEELELKGRSLNLERVIIYGKLRLDRQALSLLIHTSRDLASAEIYCHQGGDPILPTGLALVASRLGLPIPTRPKSNGNTKKPDQHRIGDLARLLVEMLLIKRAGVEEPEEFNQSSQVGRILESQALHLDITKILPLLPTDWPIHQFSSFLTQSIRSSLHTKHELSILKALSLGQNYQISTDLADLQAQFGPTIARKQGDLPEPIVEVIEEEEMIGLKEKEQTILVGLI